MNGQLTVKEREFLHQAVLDYKPELVFEVGTWKGGGSTSQIVKALEKNGKGILVTCETDKEFYEEALGLYKDNQFIELYLVSSDIVITDLLSKERIPDFLFFDGPEDRETAYDDFRYIEPALKSGSIFCMHDWDWPSIKAETIRPYLECSKRWSLISKLTLPESVGICLWKKI